MEFTYDERARAVVLVEGVSDQLALEALARRRGRDLGAEGVSIVPIGGSKNIGRFLDLFGPRGADVVLAGLCDAAEVGDYRGALQRAGLGSNLGTADMERLGFFVCDADLEDELIRAAGPAVVEEVIDAQGDLGSFRTFQRQPAWRGRPHRRAAPAVHRHPQRSEDPVRARCSWTRWIWRGCRGRRSTSSHARVNAEIALRDAVRGRSVETELVALDVLHHEARLVVVIGRQQSHAYRAERDQSCAFGLKCGQALFTHEPGADPHVKMHPILDDLAFGNALEEQSRAHT